MFYQSGAFPGRENLIQPPVVTFRLPICLRMELLEVRAGLKNVVKNTCHEPKGRAAGMFYQLADGYIALW